MQHPDLLMQYPQKHLQHIFETSETLATCASAQYHLVARTNGRSSLPSSTPAWRSMVVHGVRRCSNGAGLLRFSNVCSQPRLTSVGVALLLLLQHRCSLDHSHPASSAHRGWGTVHPAMGCGAIWEGNVASPRWGMRRGEKGGITGQTDERPGNAWPSHDERITTTLAPFTVAS
jgi:hypothetical protein